MKHPTEDTRPGFPFVLKGLLPIAAVLVFQGGFAVAVMALDRYNRGLDSNLGYVLVVETLCAGLFLLIHGLRQRRLIEALRLCGRRPLDSALPQARTGAEEAWKRLILCAREEARRGLAEGERGKKAELEAYLSTVHALKTPAAALSLMAERAEREGLSLAPSEIRLELEELDRILERAVGRQRLLDFAVGSRMERLSARKIVSASVRKHRRILIARKIALSLEGDFETSGEAYWLGFILDQFISNAAKYASTRVEILLRMEGDSGIVEILDDGPGLDEEDRERIFGRSVSGSASDRVGERGPASSGYGLYLAKEAASRLGLGLELRSEGGTMARLILPRGDELGSLTESTDTAS